MAEQLDIHPASNEERLEAYRNVHDVWSGGLSLDEHVEWRLASVQHQRADWYVGVLDRRVIASLGCYPLKFRLRGEAVVGIAIGAVHTLAEFRGRGFAPQLVEAVESAQREHGVVLSMLYSDVDPAYYARLGYLECPSMEVSIELPAWNPPQDVEPFALAPLSPSACRGELAALYDAACAPRAVSIDRDGGYWDYLLRKAPGDEFFRLQSAPGKTAGYVRLGTFDQDLRIRDFALVEREASSWPRMLAGVCFQARQSGCSLVTGWLPPVAGRNDAFTLNARTDEITMLKPLHDGMELDGEVVCDAAHFVEIDHV